MDYDFSKVVMTSGNNHEIGKILLELDISSYVNFVSKRFVKFFSD